MKPSDLLPKVMLDELRRLARLPSDFIEMVHNTEENFSIRFTVPTPIRAYCVAGHDALGLAATVRWLKAGPKIAQVTEDLYQTFAHVDINLEVKDCKLPYKEVLVIMPPNHKHRAILICQYSDDVIVCNAISYGNKDDIITVIRQRDGRFVEESLEKYDTDIEAETATDTECSLRVAFNMLLAMTNFGYSLEYKYKKEVERDTFFFHKRGDEKALERVKESPQILTLDKTVVLHKVKTHDKGVSTGKELSFHWRRGHWRMQPHGPLNSLRKQIFIAPVLVRKDLLNVDVTETTTTYRS